MERGWGWGKGEGGAPPERAGTCPVPRVCHPQLEHRPFPKLIKLDSNYFERESTALKKYEKELLVNVEKGKSHANMLTAHTYGQKKMCKQKCCNLFKNEH